ncbi:MAG TPA: BrnA antitoxin family protein [Candidatus Tectomicrobia bacterium]
MRVDTNVLEWFKKFGKGHLKRMNAVLRAYVETHKHRNP